jgi:hypothetical protein
MKVTIEIEVPEDMDLEHTLECVTDAMFMSDCVTAKEEYFVIKVIQSIQKQYEIRNRIE